MKSPVGFEQWWNRPGRPLGVLILGEQDKKSFEAIWRAAQAALLEQQQSDTNPQEMTMVLAVPSDTIVTEPRYLVESQNVDTGLWEAMATTDNLEHALGISTGKHRRVVDRQLDEVCHPQKREM